MGSWDELCILCGVAASGGPLCLFPTRDLEDVAESIAQDIQDQEILPQLTSKEVEVVVRGCLDYIQTIHSQTRIFEKPAWVPDGTSEGNRSCLAIGHFDREGNPIIQNHKVLDGTGVEVREVCHGSCGSFNDDTKVMYEGELLLFRHLNCSVTTKDNPNFFLCKHCFYYLMSWIPMHCILPGTLRVLPPSKQLTVLAGELYEIVNSRKERRQLPSGLLPEVNYDGIEDSLDQWQTYFLPCRRGVKHIARAIERGRRREDLVPALLRDVRTWMFADPAMWPRPMEPVLGTPILTPNTGFLETPSGPLTLPNELLLQILHGLSLPSVLALSATCRYSRKFITEPSFLDFVVKDSILNGELRWIFPVATLQPELNAAYESWRLWLPENDRPPSLIIPEDDDSLVDDDDLGEDTSARPERGADFPRVLALILSPRFPRLEFIRACWESDSMMCRQRLWKQVAQFGRLWSDYHRNGWQADRFIPRNDRK